MLWMTAICLLLQEPLEVEGQPLSANVERLQQALEFFGAPLPAPVREALKTAGQDARKLQQALDPQCTLLVSVNPESRVKVGRGKGPAILQQSGWTVESHDGQVLATIVVKVGHCGPARHGRLLKVRTRCLARIVKTSAFTIAEELRQLCERLTGVHLQWNVVVDVTIGDE